MGLLLSCLLPAINRRPIIEYPYRDPHVWFMIPYARQGGGDFRLFTIPSNEPLAKVLLRHSRENRDFIAGNHFTIGLSSFS